MVRLLGAVVCFAAPSLLYGPASSADPAGSVRAQIAAVRTEIAVSAGRIHQLTQAFDEANVSAVDVAQQLAADEGVLAATKARLTGSQRALRDSALQSYTGGNAGGATPSTVSDPALSSAYIAVAVGSLSESVDQYHLRQRQQEVAAAAVSLEQRAARAAQGATGTARDAAITAAQLVQARLVGLQAQLDSLQATAELAGRAEAAARAAAAAAQGGPVGNALVATVSGVVQPSVSPAPRAPAPQPAAQPPAAPAPRPAPQPAAEPAAAPAPRPAPQPAAEPAAAPAPPPAPAPGTNPVAGAGGSGGSLQLLRQCESGGNYAENTGNGFYGAYQFSASTWSNLGYPGRPDQEPPGMQDAAAMRLQAQGGWGEWPACAAALGL